MYRNYLYRQEEIITELDQACKKSKKFEAAYKKFEGQKVCYLPLNTFLLKPGQRLLHYKLLLERKSTIFCLNVRVHAKHVNPTSVINHLTIPILIFF